MAERIDVVRGSEGLAGPGKPYGGQPVFEHPGAHVGLTRLGPGAITVWHHHEACNFYGYVLRGRLILEHGAGGRDRTELSEGEFFRIPPRLVHRDKNETDDVALVATFCIGDGPVSAVVEGPDR